jgi:uncharacterized damage-inducible protein DinB
MKAYFIQLLNYDHFANKIILKAIIQANAPEKPARLMAHLLSAQQVWISRYKNEPSTGKVLWPDWTIDTFEQLINDNHNALINYLNTLNPDNFEKNITYKDTKGNLFENKLADLLAHLINHGTHHRAQIGQQLKLAGIEQLPPTDYILYLRQLNGQL